MDILAPPSECPEVYLKETLLHPSSLIFPLNHSSMPSIMVWAYADNIYLYGQDNSAWDPIAFWFHQYYLATNGTVNWGKSKVIPINPPRYTPHPSAPPAHFGPINTLGIILPLTTTNITSLWQSLITKITPLTNSLATRSLSFP